MNSARNNFASDLAAAPLPPPTVWGNLQWRALHALLSGYPDAPDAATQSALRAYLISLAALLPCPRCREHWAALAPTVDTSSRLAAMKWAVDAHNSVNARLGKPVLTYKDAVAALAAEQRQKQPWGATRTSNGSSCGGGSAANVIGLSVAVAVLFVLAAVFLGLWLASRRKLPALPRAM